MGLRILFKAWVANLIGGVGNHISVFIGGLLVGLLEMFVAMYGYPGYAEIVVFAVLLVIFILRPSGLFAGIRSSS